LIIKAVGASIFKEAPLHSLTLSTQIVSIFAAQNPVMKKTTLLLIASAFSIGLHAQTLQYGTAPEPGDVHKYREDTLQLAPGNAGQGQTWNFASLVMDTAVVTNAYVSPIGTPGASSFPAATVAQFGDSTYTYFRVTPNKTEALGIFSQASGLVTGVQVFSNPATFMAYPLSLNQTFVDTGAFTVSLGPGLSLTITLNQNAIADGTGTLILPSGTFSNVLRIKNIITNTTSSLFGNSTSVEENYSWYDPATKFPLFVVSTTTDNSGGATTVSHSVNMRVNNIGSGLEKNTSMVGTHIFPNPAQVNGALTVRTEGRGLSRILVYDVLGKRVFEDQQAQTNSRVYSIGTQGWMPGVYLVQVVQDGKTSSEKVVLE
jgi:hypothetical protein